MSRSAILLALLISVNSTAARPPQLVDKATHALYQSFQPKTDDPWLKKLQKQDLTYYNDEVMPPAYQDWASGLPGLHSIKYNISANRAEPFGNANHEFPWGKPAGLRISPNAKSIKFAYFPPDKPIVWWREQLPNDRRGASYVWRYPNGTVFGEILLVTDPDGYDHTFELRTRLRQENGWTTNAFRPFTTQQELAGRVKALVPDWEKNDNLKKLVAGTSAEPEGVFTIENSHPVSIFKSRARETYLPEIDPKLVVKLLKETPFKSALGQEWDKTKGADPINAPTTKASFHIVPKDYEGTYVEVSSKSCMRCHDTVQKHTDDFQPFRDWYGRVRGSDNIFSFHIFDPASISYNGFGNAGQISLRQELIDAGLLKRYEE